MRLTFLGTGTSTGVPMIGCHCRVCESVDIRDKRLRASAIVETTGKRLLIDCGPDFREQMLRLGSPDLDALLVTHEHYDHVGGMDDLRPYCYRDNGFPVYCSEDVDRAIRTRLPYCFSANHYPGAPTFRMHCIEAGRATDVEGVAVMPLRVMHGRLPILGYRIGRLGYVTDCSEMPKETLEALRGVDTLVVNALRREPHPSHMNLRQAIDVINSVGPRRALLTHLSHDMGLQAEVELTLPEGVEIATDGMAVDIDE